MEQVYRPADMIELHDSGFILRQQDAPESENGWREFINLGGYTFSFHGEKIAQLLKHLNVDFQSIVTMGPKKVQHALVDTNFHVDQELTVIGTGMAGELDESQKIARLSAFVEAPNLLHIKVVFTYDVNGAQEELEKSVTYSGRFTVWWSTDSEGAASGAAGE